MMTRRLGWASLLAAALACGAAFLTAPKETVAQSGDMQFDPANIMPGVVYLSLPVYTEEREEIGSASGSGTILTPDGHILTNNHVVSVDMKHPRTGRPLSAPIIGVFLFKGEDRYPELECIARVDHTIRSEEADLALVRCEVDAQGRPYTPRNWPTVPMASADGLKMGQKLFLFGYPGIGERTLTMTSGSIAGFLGEAQGGGPGGPGRAWIKHDALSAGGNSGGTAVNARGEFVGVHTMGIPEVRDSGATGAKMNFAHNIFIPVAQELIAKARSGWTPDGSAPADPRQPDPSQKQPQPQGGGVTIAGRVQRADNRQAIEEAYVLVFKPGVKFREVTRNNLQEKVLAFGVTNRNGEFTTQQKVPRGGRYTVAVLAEGFAVLSADDVLEVSGNAADPMYPWGGVIELNRE